MISGLQKTDNDESVKQESLERAPKTLRWWFTEENLARHIHKKRDSNRDVLNELEIKNQIMKPTSPKGKKGLLKETKNSSQ